MRAPDSKILKSVTTASPEKTIIGSSSGVISVEKKIWFLEWCPHEIRSV